MKIVKISGLIFILFLLCSLSLTVFATDSFCSESYTCLSEAFASEDGEFTTDTKTLYALNGRKEYLISEYGIVGKTQLTFRTAFKDSADGESIVLSGLDYADDEKTLDMLELEFSEETNDPQKYNVFVNGNIIGSFYYGQLVEWELIVNTATASISVSAKSDTHEASYTAYVSSGMALSTVEFLSNNSNLFFDGLTAKRNVPVMGEKAVIYKEGNFYCAAISTDTLYLEDGYLYLASYSSAYNQLVDVKRTMLDMPDSELTITEEGGKYIISGTASSNSEVCLIITAENGDFVRFDQVTALSDGKYSFDGFVFKTDGVYSLKILDANTKTEYNQKIRSKAGNISIYKVGEGFTEVYMYNDGTVGFDSLKAFVWDEEITPQTPATEVLKSGVPVTSIDALTLDILSSDDYIKTNTEATFILNDADTSEYDGGFGINISNPSGVSVYSAKSNSGMWNWIPSMNGKYYAEITGIKGGLIVPLGVTEFYVSNAKPSEDTFTFTAGYNSYYRNGMKKTFNYDELYSPLFKNGSLYLSESGFWDVADVVFVHNAGGSVTISQYGNVIGSFNMIDCSDCEFKTVVAGDKNISVTGSVSGTLLYNFSDVMSLAGYYYAEYENVLAVSTNADFDGNALVDVSETLSFESFDDNSITDWSHNNYPNSTDISEISDTVYYRGGRSYKLSACTKNGVYHQLWTPIGIFNEDDEITSYTISFMAKASDDFRGSKLLVCVDGVSYTICENNILGNSKLSTEWTLYSVMVPASDLSSVEKIRFDIQMHGTGMAYINESAGCVWIDDIKIAGTKKVPICYNQLKDHRISKETVVCNADFDTHCANLSDLQYYDRPGGAVTAGTNISIANGEGYNNTNALKIGSAGSGWKNVLLPPISIDKTVGTYTIRFKVKLSEDYIYNTPRISIFMYKGTEFKTFLSKAVISDRIENGEWMTLEVEIDAMDFIEMDCDNFRISLDTIFKSSTGNTFDGYVYFDDITVSTDAYVGETLVLDMFSENYASWYCLSDNEFVTYKPAVEIDGINLIRGNIYNSDNELIDSVTASNYTIKDKGWQWMPTEPGYYEIEFYAVMNDGAVHPIVSTYSYQQGHFELPRKKVAVTQNPTSDVGERDSRLYFSMSYNDQRPQLQADTFRAANLVGFKGPRWIHISWDSVQSTEGGTYDWSEVDEFFAMMDEFGYEDAEICVMNTPIWASPSNNTTLTSMGMPYYGCYAPKDEYADEYKAFLTALINRYNSEDSEFSSRISLIEIGNECYNSSTGTAFWFDTPENYVKMLGWAYDAIRIADPTIKIATSGVGDAYESTLTAWFESDPQFSSKFDYFGIHGKYGTQQIFLDYIENHNMSELKWASTESYYTAYHSKYIPADRKAQAMYFLMNIFSEVKYDAQRMTFYNIFNYGGKIEDEATVYAQKNGLPTGERFNMFRHYPFVEPEQSAVTAFNLFNILGGDFSYLGEYTFDSTQRMVLFSKENGNKVLVVWNSAGNDFALNQSILSEIGSSYIIKDMEGKTITDTNNLKGGRIYYISNIASNAFDDFTFDDSVINNSYIAPYYTCETN